MAAGFAHGPTAIVICSDKQLADDAYALTCRVQAHVARQRLRGPWPADCRIYLSPTLGAPEETLVWLRDPDDPRQTLTWIWITASKERFPALLAEALDHTLAAHVRPHRYRNPRGPEIFTLPVRAPR